MYCYFFPEGNKKNNCSSNILRKRKSLSTPSQGLENLMYVQNGHLKKKCKNNILVERGFHPRTWVLGPAGCY